MIKAPQRITTKDASIQPYIPAEHKQSRSSLSNVPTLRCHLFHTRNRWSDLSPAGSTATTFSRRAPPSHDSGKKKHSSIDMRSIECLPVLYDPKALSCCGMPSHEAQQPNTSIPLVANTHRTAPHLQGALRNRQPRRLPGLLRRHRFRHGRGHRFLVSQGNPPLLLRFGLERPLELRGSRLGPRSLCLELLRQQRCERRFRGRMEDGARLIIVVQMEGGLDTQGVVWGFASRQRLNESTHVWGCLRLLQVHLGRQAGRQAHVAPTACASIVAGCVGESGIS